MNRYPNIIRDTLILLVLLAIGISSRFMLLDLPNFKPVAAIVMFAAFWFRSFRVAGLALLLIMLASNVGLDSCPWQITCGVLGGLLAAAWLGRNFRSNFDSARDVSASPLRAGGLLLGSAFAMSLAFFVISNFSVWAMGQWYPLTGSGLVSCFAAAVPFFKYTLCGDMMFCTSLFGAWWLVASLATSHAPETVDQQAIVRQ